MENEKENKLPKKRGNFIFRQELTNLTPECNAKCAIICNLILMILFFTFGGIIISSSQGIIEISQEYTNCTIDSNQQSSLIFTINNTMINPIFLYYELHNFYMNNRDFVKSRIYPQLRGEIHVDSTNNSKCSGANYINEIFDNDTTRYINSWGTSFQGTDYANPCGLIAKSLFNGKRYFNKDTYVLSSSNGTKIILNETNISNDYDRKYMFIRNPNYTLLQWTDVENEHFIVWMQMETFPNFRKLWARIDSDLIPGNYTLLIKNNYNVTRFDGQKFAILSTSSSLGTASFFGYCLIIGGAYCLLIILLLLMLYSINKNKNFDYNSLKWK